MRTTPCKFVLLTLAGVLALSACSGETTNVLGTAPSSEEPTTLKFDRSPEEDASDEAEAEDDDAPEETDSEPSDEQPLVDPNGPFPDTISAQDRTPRLRTMYDAAVAHLPEGEQWAREHPHGGSIGASSIEGVELEQSTGTGSFFFELVDPEVVGAIHYTEGSFLALLPATEAQVGDTSLTGGMTALDEAIQGWVTQHGEAPYVSRGSHFESVAVLSPRDHDDQETDPIEVPLDERWESRGTSTTGGEYETVYRASEGMILKAVLTPSGVTFLRGVPITV